MGSHDAKSDTKLLSEKIKDIRIAMMTTVENDGSLHSRPMATQDIKSVEFDGDLWFFTYGHTPKVNEVEQHHQVNLSYAKPDDNIYVSVSGLGQLIHDPKRMKELWNSSYKAWFPKGLEEPDLALLKVHVQRAEYWDAPSGKKGLLYSLFSKSDEQSGGANVKLDMK